MIKEQIEKIKGLIVKEEKINSKKKTENLVVFLIILIVTLIAINYIWSDDKKNSKLNTNDISNKELATDTHSEDRADLEEKLEGILCKINGVGKAKVLITYSESSEVIAMYNETSKSSLTEEKDSEGGLRKIDEIDSTKEIIFTEENGVSVPVTQKVINPTIEGAIITAEGADNAVVKANIIGAVEAVTGLATHKIQVFEMSK